MKFAPAVVPNRLPPVEVKSPKTSGLWVTAVFLATIVFRRVTTAGGADGETFACTATPPLVSAVFPVIVSLIRPTVPEVLPKEITSTPPPVPPAVFVVRVLLTRVKLIGTSDAVTATAPPDAAALLVNSDPLTA